MIHFLEKLPIFMLLVLRRSFEGDVLQLYLLIFEKMQESIVGFDRVLDQPMTGIYLPSKLGKQVGYSPKLRRRSLILLRWIMLEERASHLMRIV